jgi:magnesium chelatase subunit I
VVRRRDAFERDPQGFADQWLTEDERIRRQLVRARKRLQEVRVSDAVREQSATLCMALGTDGLRGDLTVVRAARALAALDGAREVTTAHLRRVAAPALRHRLRRNPLDDAGSTVRVDRAVAEHLAA